MRQGRIVQPPPLTDDEVLVRTASPAGRGLVLGVEREGRDAGFVRLVPDGEGAAEIGYGLDAWARGTRTMSRALRLALVWAFGEIGVDVVHWRCPVGDWASRRVAWACGFAVEGSVRGLLCGPGGRQDAWVGSLRSGEPMQPRNRWLEVPRLHGDGVVLRRHQDGDALRAAEACAAESTQRWLPDLPSPYTLLHAAAYLAGREEEHAAGRGVYWAIADPDDDRLLGAIAVMRIDPRFRGGEIGYWVHPDARARGVATEATRLTARHALLPEEDGGLGLTRALLRVASGNHASRRVAERAGFTFAGRDRAGEQLRDGTVQDYLRYDLLAAELPPTW